METSKKYPDYSVLMTLYAGDNLEYFKISIDSMLKQTVPAKEIVLVVDGPVNDAFKDVLNSYQKSTKGLKIIFLKENGGLGKALNIGVKSCSCEYIARMDADDYSKENRCKYQLEKFMNDDSLAIVGYSVLEFSDNINNIVGSRKVPSSHDEIISFSRLRNPFNHPSVMLKKSKVIAAGNYGYYKKNQDLELWTRMLRMGMKGANLQEPQFYFRFDEKTLLKRKKWTTTKNLIKIRYKNMNDGYCTLIDFLTIVIGQFIRAYSPNFVQKIIYYVLK